MKDYIVRATAANAQIRAFAVTSKELVECARSAHNLSPVVTAALGSFNRVLLENHIKTCVTRDIKEGREETVDELLVTLQKLMR